MEKKTDLLYLISGGGDFIKEEKIKNNRFELILMNWLGEILFDSFWLCRL